MDIKRLFIAASLLSAIIMAEIPASAWGGLGHKTVIAIAQRHLTEKTKANIAKYIDYDLQKDAVWMDTHRKDKPIAYTTAWHVYNVDKNLRYDPSPRGFKGDCLTGVRNAVWCLEDYCERTDSAVVMNIRMLIHFVGDLHCPTHSYLPGPRCFWECECPESNFKGSFHGLYDGIPALIYTGKNADEVAELLDNCSKSQIKKIVFPEGWKDGLFESWAHDAAVHNAEIYEINDWLQVRLAPDTVKKSKELVDIELRNAGYRLAYLLNKLFDK